VSDLTHELQLEIYRREISSCTNIEAMRELSLRTLTLMENQRRWFVEQLRGPSK